MALYLANRTLEHVVMLTVTRARLRDINVCPSGYRKLGEFLGGWDNWGDSPISALSALEALGVVDTVWGLEAVDKQEIIKSIARIFACDCAERVMPLFTDQRPDDKRVEHLILQARALEPGKCIDASAAARAASAAANIQTTAGFAAAMAAMAAGTACDPNPFRAAYHTMALSLWSKVSLVAESRESLNLLWESIRTKDPSEQIAVVGFSIAAEEIKTIELVHYKESFRSLLVLYGEDEHQV